MMLKRSHYIALAIVTLLVVLALCLPHSKASRIKLALSSLFLPLFGLAGSVNGMADRAGPYTLPRRVLAERLTQLETENRQLRFDAMQAGELRRENTHLRQLIGWQQQQPWKLKLARVVGRDPANWWRTLHIDVGSREGVRTNMPVVAMEGLVGRITDVAYARSQVALVGDPNCQFSAWIVETRDHGIVSSAASATDPQLVTLTFLPNNDQIRPGQWVATSGLGAFPTGIPVGKILDTRRVGYGLYAEARIQLAAPLNRLQEVWVILP